VVSRSDFCAPQTQPATGLVMAPNSF